MNTSKVEPNGPPPAYQGTTSGGTQQPPPPPGQAIYQPPPQQQFQQPTQQPYYTGQTTVIMSQPGFVNSGYGPSPVAMQCPHCSANITTSTSRQCNGLVWMVAAIVCLFGFAFPLIWLGFCLIPFCIPSLYDVNHTCPSCQKQLGLFNAAGRM